MLKHRYGFLLLCACGLAALVSCPVSPPPDTALRWTFAAGMEGWLKAVDTYEKCVNGLSTLSWENTEGSPGAGCLKIEAPFSASAQYVSVIAPIVADPLTAGMDLSGKKLTVRVRSVGYFNALAVIFSASYSDKWDSVDNGTGATALDTADWKSTEFSLSDTSPPFDPTDVRFLGVLIGAGTLPASGTYTFYVDTAVISDAP
jgi:hypothetical protein